MSDKCPFCQSPRRKERDYISGYYRFECRTWDIENAERSKECYERQIVKLQAAVDEAKEIIKSATTPYMVDAEVQIKWLAKYGGKKD